MDPILLTDVDQSVATITLNRPKVLNALDGALADALHRALAEAERDAAVRCVVLRGAGGHFMAGGDLKLFFGELDRPPAARREHFERFVQRVHPIVQLLRRMPKPVVASVDGATGGFGMSLMLGCDLAIAADSSYFTMTYCLVGTSPDGSSTWSLPRAVGARKAMQLALLGERLDARSALDVGLINWVVPAADLAAEAVSLARRLARGPTRAYANTKRLLHASTQNAFEAQLQAEAEMFADCAASDDFAEGVRAFIEKRPPEFAGK